MQAVPASPCRNLEPRRRVTTGGKNNNSEAVLQRAHLHRHFWIDEEIRLLWNAVRWNRKSDIRESIAMSGNLSVREIIPNSGKPPAAGALATNAHAIIV